MAEKLDPETAMDMTIAQIATHVGWPAYKAGRLLEYWYCEEGEEMPKVEDLKLRTFLSNIEARGGASCWHSYRRRGYRKQSLFLYLKEIGVTRLQTVIMPRTTVSFEMIAALPRHELLKRDAGVLGTLSDRALDRLCEERNSKILILVDLLAMKREEIGGYNTASTFELLERLGFTSKDGPFMVTESERRDAFVQDLVTVEGLTAQEAKKFANIAARRNWI